MKLTANKIVVISVVFSFIGMIIMIVGLFFSTITTIVGAGITFVGILIMMSVGLVEMWKMDD